MKKIYDICLASDWEYDRDFFSLIEQAALNRYGLTTYVIHAYNILETTKLFKSGEMEFNFLLDRGSTNSVEFYELYQLFLERKIPILDSYERLLWASDKATLHLEFISNGLTTPYTIIIPPFNTTEDILLSIADLAKLGRPFIIKPANTTGGGIGVVDGAETLEDVLTTRKTYANDKYLLQTKISPMERDGKLFWFRVFFCCGLIEAAWWNMATHIYENINSAQVDLYGLQKLSTIINKIHDIVKLNFFSTEIALVESGEFIIIDYVNEMCDMRLKSCHVDGVPNEIVTNITNQLVVHIKSKLTSEKR